MRTLTTGLAAALGVAMITVQVAAQQAQGAPPPAVAAQPARDAAPIDYTGTWASVVTEDWQWRFVTPIVGDYTGVPLNAEGDKLARAWNHDADLKAGEPCKGFGAAAINRLPTRLRISWQDPDTMRLEWDLGSQSRLVHFDRDRQPDARSLQGHGIGEWIDVPAPGRRGGGGGRAGAPPAAEAAGGRGAGRAGTPPPPRAGGLRVTTTNLRPQYLRQNGVPVSEKAVITEYLDVVPGPDGSEWLVVKTMVDDPTYLSGWYIVSSQFKKEPNASKWAPTPCELLPRLKGTATQVPRQGG
jgi:hypothetical protein